jgi:RHS repeat-associated protein
VHRRTQATLEDSSIWKYAYNDRDELISGKRYWADWAPVSGQQFEYAYDNIGNRTSAKSGGDTGGSNLRTATYGANALNQYTNITTPGYKDIIGASMATNSVTVNGNATDRKVEYFHNEQTMANDSGPVYQSVSVTSGTSNVTGNVLFPPNQQAPTYDDDGNLISDGLWIYTWDSENRLVQMASATAVTSAAKRKLVFGYDAQGRRTRKQVYLWGATDWNTTPSLDQRFVYDGWNLLVELNATNNAPIRSYLWGLDLSCTLDGAGGVSGLIAVRDGGGAIHFAAFDGNGSLVALINASDLSLSAHYEYSPFGETLRATGAFAGGNPFGFSSRFTDRESNLLRYPKRDYNPVIAKWFCRDPAAEEGGNNLYAFVMNNPLNVCDSDGEGFFQDHPSLSKTLLAIIMGVKAILPGSQLPNVGREIERNRTRIEESASIGNSNRRRGSKGLGKGRGGKGAVVGALVLFAGVLTAEAAGQDASGSAADPEDGIEYNDLARNARDFVKHTREGDTAMADLDAALAAQNVSDLGGGTVGALWVLEILWDAE